jgi:hypothetical protein
MRGLLPLSPKLIGAKISNEGMEKGLSAGMNDCRRIVPFFAINQQFLLLFFNFSISSIVSPVTSMIVGMSKFWLC